MARTVSPNLLFAPSGAANGSHVAGGAGDCFRHNLSISNSKGRFGALAESRLLRCTGMLTAFTLAQPARAEREFDRLVQALRGPLSRR